MDKEFVCAIGRVNERERSLSFLCQWVVVTDVDDRPDFVLFIWMNG